MELTPGHLSFFTLTPPEGISHFPYPWRYRAAAYSGCSAWVPPGRKMASAGSGVSSTKIKSEMSVMMRLAMGNPSERAGTALE